MRHLQLIDINIKHLIFVILITSLPILTAPKIGYSQPVEPISKERLLKSLGIGGVKATEYIQLIKKHGVSFQLTPADEQVIRRTGRYLGLRGLNSLIFAIRNNYRPAQDSIDKSTLGKVGTREIIVLVANLVSLDGQNDAVTETILDQLNNEVRNYPDIRIIALKETITPQDGKDVARIKGRERQASIVLWGWYKRSQGKVSVNVHFEVLSEIPRLSLLQGKQSLLANTLELDGFSIQTRLSREMTYITLLTIGLTRFEIGDYDDAISLFTKAISQEAIPEQMINPSDIYLYRGAAYYFKAYITLDTEESLQFSIRDLNKAIQLSPELAKAHFILGAALLQKGALDSSDYDKSIEASKKSIQHTKDKKIRILANQIIGVAYIQKYDVRQAKEYFNRSLEEANSLPNNDDDKYFLLALTYFLSEDYVQALININQVINNAPEDVKFFYLYLRGLMYSSVQNYELAINDINQSIKLKPDYIASYWARADVYSAQKEYDKALQSYNQAILLNPKIAELYDDRGDIYYNQKKLEKAIADYETAIKLKPALAHVYYRLATMYSAENNTDKAIEYFSHYIQLRPQDVDGYINRGRLYQDKYAHDLAIKDWEQVVRLMPEDTLGYLSLAILYENQKNFDKAIFNYTQYIKLNPNKTSVYKFRADVYKKKGDFVSALKDFNQAIVIKMDDADAYYGRANLYRDMGNFAQAIIDLKKVVELSKDANLRKLAEAEINIIELDMKLKTLQTPPK